MSTSLTSTGIWHALRQAVEDASIAFARASGTTPDDCRRRFNAVVEQLARLVPDTGRNTGKGDGDELEEGDDGGGPGLGVMIEARMACRPAGGAALSASPSSAAGATRPLTAFTRHYVDELRAKLLERLDGRSQASDPRELIRLLSAMETLAARVEAEGRKEFARRLASADGLSAVGEIAHDMRSPLTSILFLVDTIRRGQSGPVTMVQERQLGLIYGAALGLNTMASDMIDAIRGDRLVDGRPRPFSITETILGVCTIVQPISEEKGLPVHVTLPTVDGRVGYASAISRVLLNLTSNALRYTDSGSVAIGCSELPDERVEFWVQDSGRGIPEHVLTMLYDPFRPGAMGVRFSSAGLGLTVCRTLVEAMDSRLRVDTTAGAGTRFSFELALAVAN